MQYAVKMRTFLIRVNADLDPYSIVCIIWLFKRTPIPPLRVDTWAIRAKTSAESHSYNYEA